MSVEEVSLNWDCWKLIAIFLQESLSNLWSSRELFSFGCLEDADSLENGVREFLRSIFFVLESRRLDLSFEKLESPPYPFLPDEQKYRMGLENKTSKQYKSVLCLHYIIARLVINFY